jgi:hypothetical protein
VFVDALASVRHSLDELIVRVPAHGVVILTNTPRAFESTVRA